MEPIGPYAGAYLTAMLIAVIAVRDRPASLRAMVVIAAEWLFLRLWHDATGDRSTVLMHSMVDFTALYALVRWVPVTRGSLLAENCLRAMLLLHFIWAFMIATDSYAFNRFMYLSIYNGLGYLAMAFIAGGAIKDDLERMGRFYRNRRLRDFAFRQSLYSEKTRERPEEKD